MKEEKIYLTFSTDKYTAAVLKELAKTYKMTQPELIENICKDHIESVMEYIAKAKNNE